MNVTANLTTLAASLRRSRTRWAKNDDAAVKLQQLFDVEERLCIALGEEPRPVIAALVSALGWSEDDVYCGLAWHFASEHERRVAKGDGHGSRPRPGRLRRRAAKGEEFAVRLVKERTKVSQPRRAAMSTEERDERRRQSSRARRQDPNYKNAQVDERTATLQPFVWCDGETQRDKNGKPKLVLMRVGAHVLHRDGATLGTAETLDFLWAHRSKMMFGFRFASFDITMVLLQVWPFLSKEEQHDLWDKKNVKIGRYWLMLTPEKTVRIQHEDAEHPGKYGHQAVIHDVWSMLGKGHFYDAVERWEVATPEELADLKAGKERRSTHVIDETMLHYSNVERVLAERMMVKVRRELRSRYILPRAWHSHGTLASAVLLRERVKDFQPQRHNTVMENIAEIAYYAGSAELVAQGFTDGPMTTFDVNSCFPSTLRTLPCLRDDHGSWVHSDTLPDGDEHRSFVRVTWDCPSPNLKSAKAMLLAPFPWREAGGKVWWPLKSDGGGWYGDAEVRAALSIWPGRITVHEAWTWVPTCQQHGCSGKPFAFIDRYYAMRKTATAATAKLVKGMLVSSYGRVAQVRGDRRPTYYQPEWAAWTTSAARASILRAAALAGRRLLCTATDCIAVEGNVQLPGLQLGEELGQWKRAELPRTFWLTSNMAWHEDGTKYRGSGARKLTAEMFADTVRRLSGNAEIDENGCIVPTKVHNIPDCFVTLGDALFNGHPLGEFIDTRYTFPDFGIDGREHVYYGPWYVDEDSMRWGTVPVERAQCRSHGQLSSRFYRTKRSGPRTVSSADITPGSGATTSAAPLLHPLLRTAVSNKEGNEMTRNWRAYLEQGAHWQFYVVTFGDPVAYLEQFWSRRYDTHRCECGGGPGTAARGVCWFRFDVDAVQRAGKRYDDTMMTVDHYVPGDRNLYEVVSQEENWRRHYLRMHLGVKEVRYGFDHSAGYGFVRLERAG